ncbi:hypothetical protein GCM10009853_092330 [Glycomyces scopariae]
MGGGDDLRDGHGVDGEVAVAADDPGDTHGGVVGPLESECESVTAPSELFGHDAPCPDRLAESPGPAL